MHGLKKRRRPFSIHSQASAPPVEGESQSQVIGYTLERFAVERTACHTVTEPQRAVC
jgi:hypothetical protein